MKRYQSALLFLCLFSLPLFNYCLIEAKQINASEDLINVIEPTASDVFFSGVTDTTMQVGWELGSGDGVLVLVRENFPVDEIPEDGIEYRANAFGSGSELGTGNFVVYNGTGNFVKVTGLSPGIPYHVAVYEFTGSGSDIDYQYFPARGIKTTSFGSVKGKVFTITIYSRYDTTKTSTISFFEDGYLQFPPHACAHYPLLSVLFP